MTLASLVGSNPNQQSFPTNGTHTLVNMQLSSPDHRAELNLHIVDVADSGNDSQLTLSNYQLEPVQYAV